MQNTEKRFSNSVLEKMLLFLSQLRSRISRVCQRILRFQIFVLVAQEFARISLSKTQVKMTLVRSVTTYLFDVDVSRASALLTKVKSNVVKCKQLQLFESFK